MTAKVIALIVTWIVVEIELNTNLTVKATESIADWTAKETASIADGIARVTALIVT
jgi:hypothetical protein